MSVFLFFNVEKGNRRGEGVTKVRNEDMRAHRDKLSVGKSTLSTQKKLISSLFF